MPGQIEYDPYADMEDSAFVDACENVAEKLSEMNELFAYWLEQNLQQVHDMWESSFNDGMNHKAFLIDEAKAGMEGE